MEFVYNFGGQLILWLQCFVVGEFVLICGVLVVVVLVGDYGLKFVIIIVVIDCFGVVLDMVIYVIVQNSDNFDLEVFVMVNIDFSFCYKVKFLGGLIFDMVLIKYIENMGNFDGLIVIIGFDFFNFDEGLLVGYIGVNVGVKCKIEVGDVIDVNVEVVFLQDIVIGD